MTMKEHVQKLIYAVDNKDDGAAKVAAVALACATADLFERAVVALESLAASQHRIANPFAHKDGAAPWLSPGSPPNDLGAG